MVKSALASYLVKDTNPEIKEYLEDLDIGYLSGESSVGEEELEELVENFESKEKKVLLIGDDIYTHTRAQNISKIIKTLISRYLILWNGMMTSRRYILRA